MLTMTTYTNVDVEVRRVPWAAVSRRVWRLLVELAEHGPLTSRGHSRRFNRIRSHPVGFAALMSAWVGMCFLMVPVLAAQGRAIAEGARQDA